jgi:hypothetical protein
MHMDFYREVLKKALRSIKLQEHGDEIDRDELGR